MRTPGWAGFLVDAVQAHIVRLDIVHLRQARPGEIHLRAAELTLYHQGHTQHLCPYDMREA